tara:strand:+ start:4501 stop:9342 length:4842 start_codon:yes stop_codon:yes gene_type:complete
MATFRTQLVDRNNYIPECWLDRVSNQQIVRELNGQNSYTFDIPIQDIYYPYIKHRKYIRLHDLDIDRISTTISTGTGTKQITVADSTGLKIGDYITIYETTENNWSAQANAITGAADLTVTFSKDSGTLYPTTGTRYIKIWDDVHAEKTVATNTFARRPESEPLAISSVTSTTFVADVGYDYNAGAYLFQPGRSFVAKITNINGNVLTLSRKDFDPQTSARIEKVNYTSYRISEITEKRESSLPIATIRCNHLQYDLNDTVYFKNARLSVSAGTRTFSSAFTDRIDIDTFLDTILTRQVDSDGDPLTLQSFIKGDLVRFRYNKGLIDTTASTTATIINGFVDEDAVHIASGSTLSIKGESSVFTIANQSNGDFAVLTLTAATSNTTGDDDVEYEIISKGIYTGDEIIGTCDVTLGSATILTSSITLNDGTVAHGAIFQVEGDDKLYFVDYVNTSASLVLTETIERNTDTTLNFRIKRDERELKINTGVKLLGALRQMVETFSDDRQQIHFEVNEDRSIDIVKKPDTDDMDPTSDLVIRYQDGLVKNLRGITREFDIVDFANRIIPQGATSGWLNTFSGVTSSVLGNLKGTHKTTVDNVTYLQDNDGRNFVTLGVIPGMQVTNDTQSGTATVTSIQDEAATNDRLNFAAGISSGDFDGDDEYTIDFGNSRNQIKLTTGDLKKFRFGDPIRVFRDKFEFTSTESTQITVGKGLTGTATSGSTTSMVDTTKNFGTLGVTAGMFITNTFAGKNNAFARITSVSTTTNTNDTINFTAALSGSHDFDASDTYRVTLQTQYSRADDGGVFTPVSPGHDADADDTTGSDVNLLPASPAIGDKFYFGSGDTFGYITIHFDALGTGTLTVSWEYWNGSAWTTLSFESQEIIDFTHATKTDGRFTNTFRVPTDWATTTIDGQLAYWVKAEVTAFTSIVTRPQASRILNREWRINRFTGGLILVTTGQSKGEIRQVVTNDMDTITISRRWDQMPLAKSAPTLIVAQRVANNAVRGFGYRQFTVDEAGANFATIFETPSDNHVYRNGLLAVKGQPGVGQFFTIEINRLGDGGSGSASDNIITVDGTFTPIPEKSIIEVTALPQMVAEFRSGTVFSASEVDVTPTLDYPSGTDDIWDGGTVYVTSGTQAGTSKAITTSVDQGGGILRITTAGWGTAPSDEDGVILMKEHDLHLSLADALDFVPDAGDEVVLLMKESNSPLTVGKYATKRSTVVSATQTTITLNTDEGTKFAKNMIIFVGALSITSTVSLTIDRGDQVTGKEYTISSISGDVLTTKEAMDPTPQIGDHVEVIGFVDATSITKNNIIETVYSRSDLNDPNQLYDAANQYLQKITTIEPRYTLNFVDMYEVDRDEFRFDSYELGDTITVIDNQVTGPEGVDTIRVLREEFDPSFPPDKTNTLEVGKQPLRQIDNYITTLYQNQLSQNRRIDEVQNQSNTPKCLWWDDASKLCTKSDYPNTFCNTVEGNYDGRMTREGNQISKKDCQSYSKLQAGIVGAETARVKGIQVTISAFTNTTYNDTKRAAIDVPFVLSDSSYCFILDVTDDAAPTSQIDVGVAACQIQTDEGGSILPYQIIGEELGLGGWLQVKRVSGSLTLTAVVQVHATGNDL